jgi:predicted adenylyl cyclase CyaB
MPNGTTTLFYGMPINYEFKARTNSLTALEKKLAPYQPRFIGTDHQIDTYFNVAHGRMKLREGNIENTLIHYQRSNMAGAKQSDVILYEHQPHPSLKQLLRTALGEKVVVDKMRRIYFIDNVKFHFDEVQELGCFVEVEAIDKDGSLGLEKLQEQCAFYAKLFEISTADYEATSYSDKLLLHKNKLPQ